jgi:GNAT superfamily N-acetyltransferase
MPSEEKIILETDVTDHESGHVGSIDVWLDEDREQTYLGGWYGFADDLVRRLEEDEFYGLSQYLQRRLPPDSNVGYLAGMEVREELTRQGIGSAMIEAFIDLARKQGIDVIFLHRSGGLRSSDEQLERLYKRFGFKNVKCCARDIWPVMSLAL